MDSGHFAPVYYKTTAPLQKCRCGVGPARRIALEMICGPGYILGAQMAAEILRLPEVKAVWK